MTLADWSSFGLLLLALTMPLSIALTNVALAALAALGLARLLKAPGEWRREWNPALWALAAYAGIGLAAAAAGKDPLGSLHQAAKDWHKPWTLAVLLIALQGRPRGRLAAAAAAGFATAALIGIWQWDTQIDVGKQYIVHHPRAHAFVHPVTFGTLLAWGFLGGLCFWGRAEAGGATRAAKGLTSGFLALLAAALILNQTRGALAGLAAGFAAVCVVDRGLRRWAAPLGALVLIAGAAAQFLHTGGRSLGELLKIDLSSGRYALWSAAWRIFLDHPLLGAGPGSYETLFTRYHQGIVDEQAVWGSAHNLYLHQLAERGLAGALALAAALGTLTLRAYRRARANPNAWNLWAWGAIAAFLVMNVTEVAFQNELVCVALLFIWAWAERNDEIAAVRIA